MGTDERGDWSELARHLLRVVVLPAEHHCVDYDPAGSTYELRPARHVIEAFRHILPDVHGGDFECYWSERGSYCVPTGRLRRFIEDGVPVS